MNQVATDLWPILLPTILAAVGLYIGFINKMRSQIAVLEEKVKRQEQRQDSHSKKNDDVIQLLTDFKLEMTEKIGHVTESVIKIQGDVEVINNTIAVFDSGVVSTKRRKKK